MHNKWPLINDKMYKNSSDFDIQVNKEHENNGSIKFT